VVSTFDFVDNRKEERDWTKQIGYKQTAENLFAIGTNL
jgi:hypothetical protein